MVPRFRVAFRGSGFGPVPGSGVLAQRQLEAQHATTERPIPENSGTSKRNPEPRNEPGIPESSERNPAPRNAGPRNRRGSTVIAPGLLGGRIQTEEGIHGTTQQLLPRCRPTFLVMLHRRSVSARRRGRATAQARSAVLGARTLARGTPGRGRRLTIRGPGKARVVKEQVWAPRVYRSSSDQSR